MKNYGIDKTVDHKALALTGFKEFIKDNALLPRFKPFSPLGPFLICEVFVYYPKLSGILETVIKSDRDAWKTSSNAMTFHATSFAKVLSVGLGVKLLGANENEIDVRPGDIIRLKDSIVQTRKNIAYEAWHNNDLNNSNAKKIGQEPPDVLQPILALERNRAFSNPLSMEIDDREKFVFSFPQSDFSQKVDLDEFFKLYEKAATV